MWARLTGQDAPPVPFTPPWWETLTPLAVDCEIAIEKFGCTPGEYYRRAGPRERHLIRLHLAYRSEQRQAADAHREQLERDKEEARQHARGRR